VTIFRFSDPAENQRYYVPGGVNSLCIQLFEEPHTGERGTWREGLVGFCCVLSSLHMPTIYRGREGTKSG
jgi:hypothetical protein